MAGYGFGGLRQIMASRVSPDPYRPPGEDYLFILEFNKDDDTGEPATIEFHLETKDTVELSLMLQRLLRPSGEPKLEW